MDTRRAQLGLLAEAGRLLLEYDESTGEIHRALTSTALATTGEGCDIAVYYSGIAVSLPGQSPLQTKVGEIRYNTAVQSRVHSILDQVRSGKLDTEAALTRLRSVESDSPRHAAWMVVSILGAGAAALAALLGADPAAMAVAGVSTALGLVVRQALHRRKFSLLTLPFTASLIAGLLGGWVVRHEWTDSPGLALIVPCLMLVPGPHLINSLLDLIDNHLPMSVARFGLAAGILLASSVGLLLGVRVILPDLPEVKQSFKIDQPALAVDMALAAVVTAAFAMYYNTPWRQTGLAVVGGALGHGLRSLALGAGWSLEAATFAGAFAVGLVAAWISRCTRTPVAVIAFAGAVTMMPGLQMYGCLRNVVRLSRLNVDADVPAIAATLSNGIQAATTIGALGLGLVLAVRGVQAWPQNLGIRWRHGG